MGRSQFLGQSQVQKQFQKLALSPLMIQQLKLSQQAYAKLLDTVSQEVHDNPLLEFEKYDELLRYNGSGGQGTDIADFAKDTSSSSLYDHLMAQLDLSFLRDQDAEVASLLIEEIDDRGYITHYNNVRDEIINSVGVKARKVRDILSIIQTFEPDGVGARSLKECLLIQVKAHDFDDERLTSLLEDIISNHLGHLNDEGHENIAKEMGLTVEVVSHLHQFIKDNLNPNPGLSFGKETFNQQVVPSFKVEIHDEEVIVHNLEKEKGFQLRLSEEQLSLLENPNIDEETKRYISENLKKAKELIEMIENRRKTMQHCIDYIVTEQSKFLEKGVFFLKPLLQKELAQSVDFSSSTISRLLSSKYIETPQGTFLLKTLCPRRHFGKTAQQWIHFVRELCERYPKWSDEKLCRYLNEQGINIARRTVTKYRLKAGVGSHYYRKRSGSNKK